MKVIVNAILLLYGLLSGSACHAYVYQVQHLYNANLPQHIILLSDFHENHRKSTTQRLAILDAAKKHDAYLLSEDQTFVYKDISQEAIVTYKDCLVPVISDLINDPIHFNANKNYYQSYAELDPTAREDSTPLFLITAMAHQRGIKAVTVESRQAEIISSQGGPISAAQTCKAYDNIIHDIENYDDDEIYNTFYRTSLATYHERLALLPTFFAYLKTSDKTLQEAYTDAPYTKEIRACYNQIKMQDMLTHYQAQGLSQDEAKQLYDNITLNEEEDDDDDIYEKVMCALYLFVVDTKIIHEIAIHEQQPVIIVYAGGAHIESVIPTLKAHGYDLVYAQGSLQENPLNLHEYFSKVATSLPSFCTSSSENIQNMLFAMQEDPYIVQPLNAATEASYAPFFDQHANRCELEKFLA